MQASDILGNCEATLNDSSGEFWTPTELLGYLQQFCRMAVGLKPDLTSERVVVNLEAGITQTIPDAYMQFLDADFAGNGQAVFVRTLEQIKHSKFANMANATPSDNPVAVATDKRNVRQYIVFPPSTGNSASTLQIEAAKYPAVMTSPSDTYPLPQETADSAYWYVIAIALRKTCDRQDLDRAAVCMQNSLQWFGFRSSAQFGEAPKED